MKDLYYVNIVIRNKFGELVDTQLAFRTLDEMRQMDMSNLVDKAEERGREDGMLLEEVVDSEDDIEFNKEDKYDKGGEN